MNQRKLMVAGLEFDAVRDGHSGDDHIRERNGDARSAQGRQMVPYLIPEAIGKRELME